MGAGASVENEQQNSGPPSRGQSARIVRPSSVRRQRPRSNISRTSSRGRSGSWKEVVRSASIKNQDSRKQRAAALGRKSACIVQVDKNGFTPQHIQICEGQTISFEWDATEDGSNGYNVSQVMHDGDSYKTVIGGYNSGSVTKQGFFEQQFNIHGEFKFVSAGLKTTPLTLEVWPRKDVEGEIRDQGFTPKLIRIDEGNTVHWKWSACAVPHSITEMRFSLKLGCLVKKAGVEHNMPTKSGNFRKQFNKPGLYYYQTETLNQTEMSTCIVHVRERQREYKVLVQDTMFTPRIMVIEEGDRIWWEWKKEQCERAHCIYQIQSPPLDHPRDESYKPLKNGFKWPQPTRSGLMSHEFFDAGVYYFSDYSRQEAAEYIGTIIVKPKQEEHFVELTPQGFTPDLIQANTGDRIWWTWANDEVEQAFTLQESEKCVSPVAVRPGLEPDTDGEGSYTDAELERWKVATGLETAQLGSVGVYHYRISETAHNISTCSLIVQAGPRNHTVHVTDQGFEPKVVTIHPGDRIWFVWQEGNKEHNIIQVSHQGQQIKNGFCSGATMECPSAFMHQFRHTGVYYYISEALPKSFGAIVVASYPKVHEVQVTANAIVPDPCAINLNDVVAWTFRTLRQNDLLQADTVDQLIGAHEKSIHVPPRRVMNRLFTAKGTYHFASKSFLKQTAKGKRERPTEENALERVSSVLVDELSDSSVVRVDSKGFHPNQLTIRKGSSVLWSWKESGEEAHNIVHVNPPNSDAPLSVIQGGKSFNSGKPISNNSFLYTFDDLGDYAVASQGAPGHACRIHVIDQGRRTGTPYFTGATDGGTVQKFYTLKLKCDTKHAKIYYTTDGSVPELHKLSSKSSQYYELSYVKRHLRGVPEIYDPQKGIVLRSSGLAFVRAIAVAEGHLNSQVMTSRRFWVLHSGEESSESSSAEEQVDDQEQKTAMWHWWRCIPSIKAVITQPGIMEVFWEHPPEESRKYIRGYNIFLNGISYCEMFPPHYNSIVVAGLAGERRYEVHLEVYPNDHSYLPHKSNKVIMKIPRTTNTSGPLISLERTRDEDALAIVWMNTSSEQQPVDGYCVYLNGQMCGDRVKPDENSDRCKVVIEGCQLNFLYKVVVAALPADGATPKMSNELEVKLPLDVSAIKLPVQDARAEDDDMYREYIEVRENTGDMDPFSYENNIPPEETYVMIDATQLEADSLREDENQVYLEDELNPRHQANYIFDKAHFDTEANVQNHVTDAKQQYHDADGSLNGMENTAQDKEFNQARYKSGEMEDVVGADVEKAKISKRNTPSPPSIQNGDHRSRTHSPVSHLCGTSLHTITEESFNQEGDSKENTSRPITPTPSSANLPHTETSPDDSRDILDTEAKETNPDDSEELIDTDAKEQLKKSIDSSDEKGKNKASSDSQTEENPLVEQPEHSGEHPHLDIGKNQGNDNDINKCEKDKPMTSPEKVKKANLLSKLSKKLKRKKKKPKQDTNEDRISETSSTVSSGSSTSGEVDLSDSGSRTSATSGATQVIVGPNEQDAQSQQSARRPRPRSSHSRPSSRHSTRPSSSQHSSRPSSRSTHEAVISVEPASYDSVDHARSYYNQSSYTVPLSGGKEAQPHHKGDHAHSYNNQSSHTVPLSGVNETHDPHHNNHHHNHQYVNHYEHSVTMSEYPGDAVFDAMSKGNRDTKGSLMRAQDEYMQSPTKRKYVDQPKSLKKTIQGLNIPPHPHGTPPLLTSEQNERSIYSSPQPLPAHSKSQSVDKNFPLAVPMPPPPMGTKRSLKNMVKRLHAVRAFKAPTLSPFNHAQIEPLPLPQGYGSNFIDVTRPPIYQEPHKRPPLPLAPHSSPRALDSEEFKVIDATLDEEDEESEYSEESEPISDEEEEEDSLSGDQSDEYESGEETYRYGHDYSRHIGRREQFVRSSVPAHQHMGHSHQYMCTASAPVNHHHMAHDPQYMRTTTRTVTQTTQMTYLDRLWKTGTTKDY